MFLHWLQQMSNPMILTLLFFVMTGAAMLAPQVCHRLLRLPRNMDRDAAAFDAYKAVLSMTGLVLAFSLVEANNKMRALESVVAKEAASINSVDRVLLRIGRSELADLRPALATYARSVVHDEWPLLASGQRSLATDDAFTALSKPARSVIPADGRQQAMYDELLRNLDDASDRREEILAATGEGLADFFWFTISGLLAVAFGLACLSETSLSRAVGLAAPAGAISLIVACVIIVDQPFEGDTSVKPTPIEKMLAVMARRN